MISLEIGLVLLGFLVPYGHGLVHYPEVLATGVLARGGRMFTPKACPRKGEENVYAKRSV